MVRRRRGRRVKVAIYALGGLAAACTVAVAYLNPLPVLGVLAVAAFLRSSPKLYEVARDMLTSDHETAEAWVRRRFGTDDPFLHETVALQHNRALNSNHVPLRTRFQEEFEEVRILYIPLDGSDRHPRFQRDFNPLALPMWLRIALLPDLCGLNVGGVRRWAFAYAWGGGPDLDNRQWGTELTTMAYRSLNIAPELVRWQKAYPQIRALLGFDTSLHYEGNGVFRLMVTSSGKPGEFVNEWLPNSVLNLEGEEPEAFDMLPYEILPFSQEQYPGGHVQDGWLYFGEQFLDKQAGGHWLKIDDLTHFLVMGTSGFGKSVFLNQILQGVRHNIERFDQVLLIDLKGGVELWPYQALGQQFRVVYRFEDLHDLVAGLVVAIEARLEEMRGKGERNWSGRKTLLVIDEYAQIQLSPEGSKEERQKKQELLSNLNKISMLGRAAGVLIWAQLQKGTTDVMDSSFRANLASQVCFKVPNKLTAAGMFGSTDEILVDPIKLPKGRFVLFDAGKGETYYLQARVV